MKDIAKQVQEEELAMRERQRGRKDCVEGVIHNDISQWYTTGYREAYESSERQEKGYE